MKNNRANRTPLDRDEKRRVLLSKNNVKSDLSKDNLNTHMSSDAETRSGAAVLAKVQNVNKRVLAIILAVVMVLGLLPLGWFSLRGRADDGIEGLLPVTMAVRANGANNYTTADIAPGNISENINDADFKNDLPSGVTFQKAIMRDNATGSETEIKAVSKLKDGSGNEKVYYAFDEDATTGTLLKTNQELILVMSAKYLVSLSNTSEEHGRVKTSAITDSETSNFVWGGSNLRIQVAPEQDYAIDSITYTVNGQTRTATVANNSATIPANDITGNISIDVSYAPITSYGIYEVQYMPNSKYYPELYRLDNLGGLTTGKTNNDNGANETTGKLKNTPTGQDAVFYLYSKSNTGGTTHVLNMLSINGVDINFPAATGTPVPTDFGNNRTITVEMKETQAQLVWNGDTSGSQQYRTYYEIIIPDVHEDLEVALNFKEREDQQIIIKGLRGISQTGAAVEKAGADRYLHLSGAINDSWFGGAAIGTRNYVKTTSKNNIYNAYYNQNAGGAWSGWIPSNNYYIYQVKPGYNPYSVKGQNLYAEYYDQNGTLIERVAAEDLLAGDSTADRPDVVIKKAAEKVDAGVEQYVREQFSALGEFGQDVLIYVLGKVSSNNSEIRFWGSSTDANLINGSQATRAPRATIDDWRPSAEDLILTSIKKEETADPNVRWYAIALNQNEAKNQQLYMNAVPFNYSLQLDTLPVNDVTFSTPTGYTNPSANIYLETAKHTVEDNQAYIVTPNEVPTRTGYVFEGWELEILNGAGTKVGTKVYQSNEQVVFTDDVLRSGVGDPENSNDLVLPLKAIWTPIIEADTTKVRSTVYYQDLTPKDTATTISDTIYNVEFQSVETQTTGEYVAFLNTHKPAASKYYSLNVASHLEGYVQAQQTDATYNEFTAIYDLKFVDFTLKKEVNGNISASQFDITLTLTRPADYPAELTNQDILDYISYTNTVPGDENAVSAEIVGNTIKFTKTFKDGDTVAFTSLPYGWDYTVAEAKSQDDNFDTIINTNGLVSHTRNSVEAATYTGTLEENTEITVNNQRAYDDPNIVSDKWLEKDANGTYKLTMETYATGKEVADEDAETVPLDIALVIDQSSSMGTQDMNATPVKSTKTTWTVSEATSGTQKYVKVGDDYYPVQAQEGVLYEAVSNPVYIYQMIGRGHDGLVMTEGLGSPVHYNVPTKYYTLDSNNMIHKVYVITVGEAGQYAANTYYYTDNTGAKEVVTDYSPPGLISNERWTRSNVLVNEEHPYNNGNEWTETITWFDLSVLSNLTQLDGLWNATNLYKTQYSGVRSHYNNDTNYVSNDLLFSGSYIWRSLAYNGQVCFVGQSDATIPSANANLMHYSWFTDGSNANANHNLYLPKTDSSSYNGLYYYDSNGTKHTLGDTVYTESQIAYSGDLYEFQGTPRIEALQEAVTQFTQEVATNASTTGANHRIAIVGFAGNKFPSISTGNTAYEGTPQETTKYDYTDTGVFINREFHNYETITGYVHPTTIYSNVHYYVKDGNDYIPVSYRGGKWYRIGTNTEETASTTNFWEPVYEGLTDADYAGALVSASQGSNGNYNGIINDDLTTAINHFGYYGQTYTSYGMAMANNIFDHYDANSDYYNDEFEDQQGNTQHRKRIIVVFTDGEPGANGYSEAIAGEALADSNIAKNDANTTVYTIGLFPGDGKVEPRITTFMEQLSSEYTTPLTPVYAATTRTANNNYGCGDLNPNQSYYYTDVDGKTYAVTTQHNGLSSLGWWSTVTSNGSNSYIPRYPKTGSNDSRTINGSSVISFYRNANGTGEVFEGDLNLTQTYYTRDGIPIVYEYRWYNSNDRVKDPKTSASDNATNHWQFVSMGNATQTDDGNDYYFEVRDPEALANAFATAFQTIKAVNLGNTMTLTDKTSFVRDVISENFEFVDNWSENSNISIDLIPATKASANAPIVPDREHPVPAPQSITVSPVQDGKTIEVHGFDFSSAYIDDQSNAGNGRILRIVVTGLKPKVDQDTDTTGGIFESNLKESGVFKQEWDEEHNRPVEDSQKLLDAFPMPSISRYKYTITVDGDDTNSTHATAFELLDGNGNQFPVEDDLSISDLNHDTPYNNQNWSSNSVTNTEGNKTRSIIFEQINDVVQFETRLTDDAFKHADGIPDDYQVQYTVTGNDMDTSAYEFTKSIDKGNPSNYADEDNEANGVNFTRIMSKDHNTTVDISSEEQTVLVNIQEITEAMDPNNDFSDPTKEFDIVLTLFGRDGQTPAAGYTYGDYEFGNDGTIEVPLANTDSVTLEIPKGYYLAVDVKPSTQDGYTDTYRENGADVYESGNVLANEYEATQINSTTFIQVINKNEAPVVTGFNGIDSIVNPFIIAAGVVALIGGAWLGIMAKRRRDAAKQ